MIKNITLPSKFKLAIALFTMLMLYNELINLWISVLSTNSVIFLGILAVPILFFLIAIPIFDHCFVARYCNRTIVFFCESGLTFIIFWIFINKDIFHLQNIKYIAITPQIMNYFLL